MAEDQKEGEVVIDETEYPWFDGAGNSRAEQYFIEFFKMVPEEPRFGHAHMCLYLAILTYWISCGLPEQLVVSRDLMMRHAKICSRSTYNKVMQELHSLGLIRYNPARSCYGASVVFIRPFVK